MTNYSRSGEIYLPFNLQESKTTIHSGTNSYVLGGELGRGGTEGQVSVGYRTSDHQLVAAKIGPHLLEEQPLLERQAECIQTLSRDIPGIPRLVEFISGISNEPTTQDCLITEVIPGWTLEQYMISRESIQPFNPLPLTFILSTLSLIAESLTLAAEKYNILNRDTAPENCVINSITGQPVIVDWGLASSVFRPFPHTFFGKLRYAPPEAFDPNLGQRSLQGEVYSLSVIFHELMTGKWPYNYFPPRSTKHFTQDEQISAAARVKHFPPLVSLLDAKIAEIQLRALSKNPGNRQCTPVEYVMELKQALQDQL